MILRRVRSRAAHEGGFTVIEMLVTMLIIGIVFAAFGLVISTTVTHSALITNESVTQHQVRTALNQMTEDLREASAASSSSTSPFVTAAGSMSPTTITFYAPDQTYSVANPDAYHLREISYQLSSGNFQRASAVSSNTSDNPNGTSFPWTIPALGSLDDTGRGGRQLGRFTYYDGSQPPVPTTNPAAVRTVVVTVTRHGPRELAPVQLLRQRDAAGDPAVMSRLVRELSVRQLLRRLKDESGQTMMLVVFAIAFVSTLAVGLTDLVTSEAQSSGQAVSSDSAYQAAEAGIDSYAAKLLDDHLYFLHYVAEGESTTGLGRTHRRSRRRLDRRCHVVVPLRPGQLEGRSATATPTTSRSRRRAARRRSRRSRSRSSRPAAAGTATSTSAARPRTPRSARSRRCSFRPRSRTSR